MKKYVRTCACTCFVIRPFTGQIANDPAKIDQQRVVRIPCFLHGMTGYVNMLLRSYSSSTHPRGYRYVTWVLWEDRNEDLGGQISEKYVLDDKLHPIEMYESSIRAKTLLEETTYIISHGSEIRTWIRNRICFYVMYLLIHDLTPMTAKNKAWVSNHIPLFMCL